jgi:predicted Zn-dependent protease
VGAPRFRTTASGLVLAFAFVAGAPWGPEGRTVRAQTPVAPLDPSIGVSLVPLGPVPPALATDLVTYFRSKLGLTIAVLAPMSVEPAAMDRERVQVVAEELAGSLRRLPQHGLLIGLTSYDMYIRGSQWEWAFAYRDGQRVVVVSTARMDESNWGLPVAPDRLRARLRKMVAKNLGVMYYGLTQTSDRRSVLFGPILGLDDLDAIGEDFRP